MKTLEASMVAMETRLLADATERENRTLGAFRQLVEIVDSRLPPGPPLRQP